MPRLLFKLTHVPDDEAQDIRNLLGESDIHFYETDAGFWRVGVDAIWLPSDSQYEQAKQLIASYQQQRSQQQQEYYAALKHKGDVLTLWQSLTRKPFRVLGIVVIIVFILALMLLPFFILTK